MKIFVVHEISYFDGPVFEFQEFTESFIEAGHDVLVLDLKERQKKGIRKAKGESHGRIYSKSVKVISPRLFIANDLLRPLAVFAHAVEIFRVFRNFRPDIVFSYSVPTSGTTVALMGRFFKVPVVHRCVDISHKLRPGIFTPFVFLAEWLTFKLSNFVSTHNGALAGYVMTRGGTKGRVFIHHPPVDTKQFTQKSRASKGEPVHILFLGTLSAYCGLDKVLESIPLDYAANSSWRMRIVGDGEVKDMLEGIVERKGLSHSVEFRGWVPFSDLAVEMRWATVGIVPFEKNMLTDCALPQKTIQFLASGLPVVSTSLLGSKSELSRLKSISFVENPDEIFEKSLSGLQAYSSDRELISAMFEKKQATNSVLNFLREAAG